MSITRYAVNRLLAMIPTLLILTILVFLMVQLVPGDPAEIFLGEKHSSPELLERVRHEMGLDQPLYVQYLRYMGNALRGDFGISYQSPTESVLQLIGRAWPVSIKLGGMAIVVAFSSGLLFGILAAVKQNSMLDYVVTFISTLGLTVPSFVIAIWLLLLFAVRLRWLPTGGWPSGGSGDWKTMIMPVITLALGASPS